MSKLTAIALASLLLATALPAADPVELKRFPTDSLGGLEGTNGVRLDKKITKDGNGSISIRAREPGTYELINAGDIDIEEAQLVFRAKMMSRTVKGAVYLEIVCNIPGFGRASVEALQYSLSRSHYWVDVEARYPLRKGENPDDVRLNLVFDGTGKAWIDDIRLYREDLPPEPDE
jgi:hypothetical protein